MSILQKNLINKNNSKNIFGEKNPNIFLNDKICSTNIPKHYFTNYIDYKKHLIKNIQL